MLPKTALAKPLQLIFENGADREVNKNVIQMGILKSFRYPTGGIEYFEYEPNDYADIAPIYETVHYNTDATLAYYPGMPSQTYTTSTFYVETQTAISIFGEAGFGIPCNGMPGIPSPEDYFAILVSVPSEDAYPEFNNIDQYFNGDIVYKLEYGECKNNELNPFRGATKVVGPGWYRLVAYCGTANSFASVSASFNKITGYDAGVKAGGVRIKKMSTNDALGQNTVKKYEYRNLTDATKSSGVLISYPLHKFTTDISYPDDVPETFEVIQSSSLNPLSTAAHGSFIGYDAVTEYHGENGENGKIVSTFMNGYYNSTLYVPPADVNFLGHPLIETVYAANGEPVTKVENYYTQYGPSERQVMASMGTTYPFLYDYSDFPEPSPHEVPQVWPIMDPTLAISYFMDVYGINIDWWRLTRTTITRYTPYGNTNEVVHYSYNTQNKLVASTTTELGNNVSKVETIRYPNDYSTTAGDVYAKMVNKHMLDYPIEIRQCITRGANTNLTSSTVNEYQSYYSDKFIKPARVLKLNTISPVPSAQAGTNISPYTSLLFDPNLYSREIEFKYDLNGNPVTTQTSKLPPKSFQYSKINFNLIASTTNDPTGQSWFDNFEEPNTFNNIDYDYLKAHTGQIFRQDQQPAIRNKICCRFRMANHCADSTQTFQVLRMDLLFKPICNYFITDETQ